MARTENPPFERGMTFYNGGTIDANNLGGVQHEGKIWEFEDLDYSNTSVGAKKQRSGRMVKCMCVRNVSGIALLPKRLAGIYTAGADGKYALGRVAGYTTTTNERGYPIDEFLPAAGVPANDLFWVVVEGPAMCITDLAAGAGNVINVGSYVDALTAATSQCTTAGRVEIIANVTASMPLRVGMALSAVSTTNTNADLLIEVGHW